MGTKKSAKKKTTKKRGGAGKLLDRVLGKAPVEEEVEAPAPEEELALGFGDVVEEAAPEPEPEPPPEPEPEPAKIDVVITGEALDEDALFEKLAPAVTPEPELELAEAPPKGAPASEHVDCSWVSPGGVQVYKLKKECKKLYGGRDKVIVHP